MPIPRVWLVSKVERLEGHTSCLVVLWSVLSSHLALVKTGAALGSAEAAGRIPGPLPQRFSAACE